jgi:hypothetical protein
MDVDPQFIYLAVTHIYGMFLPHPCASAHNPNKFDQSEFELIADNRNSVRLRTVGQRKYEHNSYILKTIGKERKAMDTMTLLIIVVALLLLFGGGGYFYRSRRS